MTLSISIEATYLNHREVSAGVYCADSAETRSALIYDGCVLSALERFQTYTKGRKYRGLKVVWLVSCNGDMARFDVGEVPVSLEILKDTLLDITDRINRMFKS